MKPPQFIIVLLSLATIISGIESRKLNKKQRRSALSLPSGTSLSVTMDFIVPVVPLMNTTLTYLWFDLPFTFDVPTASDLNEIYVSLGLLSETKDDEDDDDKSRSLTDRHHEYFEEQRTNYDRRQVYEYVEGFFQNFGFDGPACLKRSICELAETPLGSHGLFGKVLELLFQPTLMEIEPQIEKNLRNLTTLPPELHFVGMASEDDYTEAFFKGRQSGGCPIHFPKCPISIFKILDF